MNQFADRYPRLIFWTSVIISTYIADYVVKRLLCENCTQQEYRNILKIVEERILGKSCYDELESQH